jgi:rare lipoprotein A
LGCGVQQALFKRWCIANQPPSRIMIVTAVVASLCACSVSKSHRPTVDETTQLSPRVIKVGDPVPKGGGFYKLGEPYLAGGKWYVPVDDRSYDRVGLASWYGDFFHGRRTANGEVYDMNALSAAHPTLPMPAYATVTNLSNNRSVVVRINDRGPYHDGRIIDLSHKAAELLGFFGHGTAAVRVRYLGPAPLDGDDSFERAAVAKQPWAARAISNAAPPKTQKSSMLAAPAGRAARPAVAAAVPLRTPKSSMLAIATLEADRPLVVKKGGFEAHRNIPGSTWLTIAEPAITNPALYVSGR